MSERGRQWLRAGELGATLLVVWGFWRVYSLFMSNGYLGPPFVFDIGDTFMDWFNTAYWAHSDHAYDVWRTIYLPLSFVITGLFGDPRCYRNAPYDARDCDVVGIVVILCLYLISAGLAAYAFWRRDRATAPFRSVAFAIGQPLLFTLERGQPLFVALIAFIAVFGGLLGSRRWIAVAAGVMANMKVYLVFPIFAYAIKRRWRLFELCVLASIGIYVVTLLIVGAGTPFEFIDNLQNWFGARTGEIWDDMLYTTTYKPILMLDVKQYPIRDYLPQRFVDALMLFVQLYIHVLRGLCWLCIVLAWLYPKRVPLGRLVFFILMQSFIDQNPGGYALTFITFLLFMEKTEGPVSIVILVLTYLLCFPSDWTLVKLTDVPRQSWLSNRVVMSEYVVPWGAIVRPGIIAVLVVTVVWDTLVDVFRSVRLVVPSVGLSAPAGAPPLEPGLA